MSHAPFTPQAEFLDPATVRLERAAGGRVAARVGDRDWPEVMLRLIFPLTQTERMIALMGPEEEYIGTLSDLHDLDDDSRRIAEEELRQQYFRPSIVRIQRLRKRMGLNEMEAVTDAGPRLIRFRSPRDDIRELGPGRYLLTDAAGNRYELPCIDALDSASQALWHNLV